jgi:hypothetical protein
MDRGGFAFFIYLLAKSFLYFCYNKTMPEERLDSTSEQLNNNSSEIFKITPQENDNPSEKDTVAHSVQQKLGHLIEHWWYKAGPGEIEKRFVDAHANILSQIEDKDRKIAFEKLEEKWRSAGKKWGIAATVVDFGLTGLSGFLSIQSFINPEISASWGQKLLDMPVENAVRNRLLSLYSFIAPGGIFDEPSEDWKRSTGKRFGLAFGTGSVGTAVLRPAHIVANAIAGGTEFIRVGKAKSDNYVDSGKAAEHARALGKGLEKGLEGTAQFIKDNPEVVQQTIKTAGVISKEKQKVEYERQKRVLELEALQKKEADKKKQEELQKIREDLFKNDQDYYQLKLGENITSSVVPEEKVMEKYNERHPKTKGKK